MEQGYLAFSKGLSARIRSIIKPGADQKQWVFTFKQKVKDRVVEIEKKISERDGLELWEMAVGKLKKRRYIKLDNYGNTWDIDFLYAKSDSCYFSLAEVELDEGAPRPKKLPDYIGEFLVYPVDLTDDRFSNKRLGDVDYATCLYKSLISKEGKYERNEDSRCG